MRLDAGSASWQFALGERIILPGTVIPIEKGVLGLQHASGDGMNLAFCQLVCIQKHCDFFAYSNAICIMMNRGSTDPRKVVWAGASQIHSVMVNMAKWTDYDAGGSVCACVIRSLVSRGRGFGLQHPCFRG